jgi:hypothetical protein
MLLMIIYDLFAGISAMAAFVIFLITFNTAFRGCLGLFIKFKIKEVTQIFREKPIRAGLNLVAFLIFFSTAFSYLIPVDITEYFVIRSIFIRIPLILAEAAILWIVIKIEHGEWHLKGDYYREETSDLRPLEDK